VALPAGTHGRIEELDREVRKRAEEKRAACSPHTAEPYWPTFDLRFAKRRYGIPFKLHTTQSSAAAGALPVERRAAQTLRRAAQHAPAGHEGRVCFGCVFVCLSALPGKQPRSASTRTDTRTAVFGICIHAHTHAFTRTRTHTRACTHAHAHMRALAPCGTEPARRRGRSACTDNSRSSSLTQL